MTTLRTLCREYLLQHVETVLASQDEAGHYWGDFGFATELPTVYHQYAHYPLAVLYLDAAEDNRYRGDARLLLSVERSLEATCRALHADGTFTLTSRGFDWGRGIDEWRTYFWMRTVELLGDRLDADLHARCRLGITRATEAVYAHVAVTAADEQFALNGEVANHFIWHVLLTFRAGQWLEKADWQRLAAGLFRRIIHAQQPDGYWLEWSGFTTSYNFVSLEAISLYHEFSGEEEARAAVDRALELHKHFTYPDGSLVEVADGRVRYTSQPLGILPPSWARSAQGAAYLRQLVTALCGHPFGEGHQEYAFFTDVYQFIPDYTADEPLHLSPRFALQESTAAVRRDGPWVLAASALTQPAMPENRWILDRQNHLALWHQHSGHLAGGGGSKEQPDFSTFSVTRSGAHQYLADDGQLRPVDHGEELTLRYGDVTCRVCVILEDARTVLFEVSHDAADAAVTFRLPLDLRPTTRMIAGGKPLTLGSEALTLPANGASSAGWTLDTPDAATLSWPVLPFNSYRQDNLSTLDSAALVLACPVGTTPVRIRISVHDNDM